MGAHATAVPIPWCREPDFGARPNVRLSDALPQVTRCTWASKAATRPFSECMRMCVQSISLFFGAIFRKVASVSMVAALTAAALGLSMTLLSHVVVVVIQMGA